MFIVFSMSHFELWLADTNAARFANHYALPKQPIESQSAQLLDAQHPQHIFAGPHGLTLRTTAGTEHATAGKAA